MSALVLTCGALVRFLRGCPLQRCVLVFCTSRACGSWCTMLTLARTTLTVVVLGVILFNMIAGFLPFEAPNIKTLFYKICGGHYRFPPYLSEEVKDFISKMLTNDFQKRSTVAEIRNHEWYNNMCVRAVRVYV